MQLKIFKLKYIYMDGPLLVLLFYNNIRIVQKTNCYKNIASTSNTITEFLLQNTFKVFNGK